ncbi:MAG: YeeE/YedE family protein [Roseovarius sp.]|nr:YeeE/YedE family protein [Roseovarius sp.]
MTEFRRREPGTKLAVWLFAFSVALASVQAAIMVGWLDVSQSRMIAATGSMSGAAIGGALFGIGMICARGCATRLLVLSATGNLRALLAGLIFAVAAQSAYRGLLALLRVEMSGWWLGRGRGGSRDSRAAWRRPTPWPGDRLGLANGRSGRRALQPGQPTRALLRRGSGARDSCWLDLHVRGLANVLRHRRGRSLTFSGPSAELLMLTVAPFDKKHSISASASCRAFSWAHSPPP